MTDNTVAGWKAKVPNILTIGRILFIPILIWGILELRGDFNLECLSRVLALFVMMCATDFFDGFFARRWGVTSDFGRMIDPIADKLLVAGSLVAIVIAYNGDWLVLVPALAIVGRDLLVSGAREHAALKSRAMPPTKLAKWKTGFEMLAIALLILQIGLPFIEGAFLFEMGAFAVLWLAAILSVYTGCLYFRASLKD